MWQVSGALTARLTSEMLDREGLWKALRKLHEWRSIASGILKGEASFSSHLMVLRFPLVYMFVNNTHTQTQTHIHSSRTQTQ